MAKKKTAAKKLVGFARLRITDPDLLRRISQRAGQKAQRLHGKKIRWTKKEAKANARSGGRAVQRQYKRDGHPLQIAAVKREAESKVAQGKVPPPPPREPDPVEAMVEKAG